MTINPAGHTIPLVAKVGGGYESDYTVPGAAPTQAPDYTYSAGTTSITATITNGYGATSYEVRIDGGTAVSGTTASGLTENTTYSFQVRGVNAFGSSDWSTVQDITTATAGSYFFTDSFETGDFSKTTTSDTSTWEWVVSGTPPTVETTQPRTGTYSSEYVFGPDAALGKSQSQLNFNLGKAISEIWVEWYLYIPSNFYHRLEGGSSNNNKFMQINFDGPDYQALTIEYDPIGDGNSDLVRFKSASENPGGGTNWPSGDTYTSKFIGPDGTYFAQIGQWNQFRVHFKSSTDGTANDGYAALWANGSLVHELDWAFWDISSSGLVNGGYFLGAANSGFANQTKFYIDDVTVYDTDPGW